ncbi:MAG: methionyl-tRNA formyltransferase [Prochlorococcus marinus CUG1431]|uniref:Methionyl-tRNA formyltransferase n=1 Tax=Prochlorococcus marinus CUG1433 TaxID=2774506 RepID=A0A9D9BRV5_PROMR|nr:methionyl-tRNA formyltransferase [Prochlorococcus marinus CUG1433]MBO6980981.1 methionyl-tRNA formyltransferase [Prochlorococcus marinus CUG1431]
MRIIFWGTPEYSIASLDIFIKSKHEVVAVVSQPDKKRSRGNKLISSPVKRIAEQESIKIYTPEKIKGNTDFINELKSLSCDLFIVIAYGKILPKEILEIPKFGCWNAHASLLPRWRGAAPIQWSLIKGDEFTGVGIMKMNEGLDTGDILLEEKIKIDNNDNLNTLMGKLSILSAKLFLNGTSLIEENINKNTNFQLTKQNNLGRGITYARMIEKSDYKVVWSDEALKISQKIKALYPRANTTFRGKNLKIIKIKVLSSDEIKNKKYILWSNYSKPGIIVAVIENEGIIISTKTDPIILLEAKLEGKNISSKNQLIQQLKPTVGDYFSD